MGNPADLAGVGGVPAFDRRGRRMGGSSMQMRFPARIDIGGERRRADEVLSFVVDTLDDDDGDDFSPGDRSLREVIGLANVVAGVADNYFPSGTGGEGAGRRFC